MYFQPGPVFCNQHDECNVSQKFLQAENKFLKMLVNSSTEPHKKIFILHKIYFLI